MPALPSALGHVADADARLVVHDRADALAVGDGRVGRAAQVDEEGLVRLAEAVAVDQDGDGLAVSPGAKVSVPEVGLVVAAGRGGAVGGGVSRPSPARSTAAESVTVNVADRVPAWPSVTVASPIVSDGRPSSTSFHSSVP